MKKGNETVILCVLCYVFGGRMRKDNGEGGHDMVALWEYVISHI